MREKNAANPKTNCAHYSPNITKNFQYSKSCLCLSLLEVSVCLPCYLWLTNAECVQLLPALPLTHLSLCSSVPSQSVHMLLLYAYSYICLVPLLPHTVSISSYSKATKEGSPFSTCFLCQVLLLTYLNSSCIIMIAYYNCMNLQAFFFCIAFGSFSLTHYKCINVFGFAACFHDVLHECLSSLPWVVVLKQLISEFHGFLCCCCAAVNASFTHS